MQQAPDLATPNEADEKSAPVESGNSAKKKQTPPTPMMAQFFEIKAVNPGYLLFYRMGDFYELFFEDAQIAAAALGIALTTRGSHLGSAIPMCGVPVRAHSEYLRKLISLGHRVAICEQMENPAEAKKRGNKSVVKRDVVRLVTPGTITEDELLPLSANNYLGALATTKQSDKAVALAWADISTGETFVKEISMSQLPDELGRLNLAELILTQSTKERLAELSFPVMGMLPHVAVMDAELFYSENAPQILAKTFAELDLADYSRVTQSALGALVSYVGKTQKEAGIALRAPSASPMQKAMQIDLATWSSLEVLHTNRGEIKGSLRHAIDRCVTAAGSRLLSRRLSAPLLDPLQIASRLDMVETLVLDPLFAQKIYTVLRNMPDITRPVTRLNLGRGGPRDLFHIAQSIQKACDISVLLADQTNLPSGLKNLHATLTTTPLSLAKEIFAHLVDQPPIIARDGGFVRAGCEPALDTQRDLATKSRAIIAQMQADLSVETEVKNLKIKHNKVLGYFVEVAVAHGTKLLKEPFLTKFIHRQTMANAMRFTTTHLSELEGKIAQAQFVALDIELKIFDDLLSKIIAATDILRQTAEALAELDVSYGLAKLAADHAYCRPKIDNSLAFDIKAGRHPVVEQTLRKTGETFITNDCNLTGVGKADAEAEAGQLWLVTGPNMGGKSTFLRQNALIAILAQIGSYVPAEHAHIGIVDRLFSRVGASDDIARGRSTFMVEMVETAAILNKATKNSLVILDEIGRGTATFDGLSIAWATTEALHQHNKSRALFATHFHEMTALSTKLERVSNHTMKARECRGDVVFLHEVVPGAADRSYGIQVARLAGLSENVVERAKEILNLLENQDANSPKKFLDDLPLFSHRAMPEKNKNDKLHELVRSLKPDDLSPLQALEFLYALKKTQKDGGDV